MKKIPCSVGILTFNSAHTLRRALESVKDFDDIIICDGGSTDSTLEIAQEFGARVITQDARFKNPDGSLKDFGGVRNQMLDAAVHDWFLYIDSDETISDGLREDITCIASAPLKSSEPLVYKIPYGIMLEDRRIKYSSSFPGYQTRFFNKKSGARFIKEVHERIEFPANVSIGILAHPWFTHTTRDEWIHYVRETAKYRRISLERMGGLTFGAYCRFVYINLRGAIATCIRALYIYLRYGFRDTLPVRGELGRVANLLIMISMVTRRSIADLL